ncbi:MAG: methyl-accepting chemotaxis protein [Phycisphaerales bacterium]
MRIRTKVIGLAAVPCVALLAISVHGWTSLQSSRTLALNTLHDEIETASKIEELNESITLLLNADRDAHQALIAEKEAIYTQSAETRQQAIDDNAENLQQVSDRAALASSVFNDEMRAIYTTLVKDYNTWRAHSRSVLETLSGETKPGQLTAMHAQSVELFNAMRKHIDDLQILEEGEIAELTAIAEENRAAATAQVDRSIRNATVMYLGLGGGSLALTVGMALVICRSVFGRLGSLLNRMTEVAQGDGDLTVRINDSSKDECGSLAQQFDTFVGRVQEIMKSVSDSAHSVASASTEIAASNEEMSTGLALQSEQTTQVSEATQRMAETATEVADRSTEGGNVVSQTIKHIEEIADAVQQSADKVGELGRKSEQIGQIIAVINDIADQTNLLALNAAIEAARAGEHGRGFAVVADEVRKLAERTTQATEQVGSSIREIQTETGSAVTNMQEGREKVQTGVQFARRAGEALSSIVAAAEQQNSATQEISTSIEHLNSVASQSRQGAEQAATAASQLSVEAEKLQSLVGRFKV